MQSTEHQTYQPKWEEKKAEDEKHRHHHHHHHSYGYGYSGSSSSSRKSIDLAGWLKIRDKQAWVGLMVLITVGVLCGIFYLVNLYREELMAMPHANPSEELKVDALGVMKVDEADALLLGDSLARELRIDTIVRTVKGEEHNVYRPPRKNNNDLIDGREWSAIKKNIRHWFKANGSDPKLILVLVAFGLLIIGLSAYGIYKYTHPHGREH